MEVKKEVTGYSKKSSLLCAILALPFGIIGVHKFYVGRTKAGFLHILASIFFIGIPMVLLDLYKIIKGEFKDIKGKNLKPIPILVRGTYQERFEKNKEYLDETALGKLIRKFELSKEVKQNLKEGNLKEAFNRHSKEKENKD
tara:strand:- start:105 stop:530 length:426 start_codon:yes stop_codon:yes gene_type:complete